MDRDTICRSFTEIGITPSSGHMFLYRHLLDNYNTYRRAQTD
jgi:hypothetical protein